MTDLRGARVWITGASRGIGAALAEDMAARGASLVLSARTEAALRPLADRLEAQCELVDLCDETSRQQATQRVLDAGKVDIMVHNAGMTQRSLVKDTELSVHRRIMELNYFAPVALDQDVLPPMIEAGAGHVVYVSSVAGCLSTPLRSAYAASKHALQGYAESVRAELYDDGVRVTVVCPGFVNTEISKYALAGDGSAHGINDTAQTQGLDPKSVAASISRAIEKNKADLFLGGKEVAGVYVQRFLPNLARRLIRKVAVT